MRGYVRKGGAESFISFDTKIMIRFSSFFSYPQPQPAISSNKIVFQKGARISKIMNGEDEIGHVKTPSGDVKYMS